MISQFSIQNFKSIKNADFDFAHLNILAGQNGIGKSSLIQSLLLLRQSYLRGYLSNRGLWLGGENSIIRLGQGKDVFYESAGENEYLTISFTDSNQINRLQFSYNAESDILPLYGVNTFTERTSLFSNGSFQYISADRIAPTQIHEKSETEIIDNNHLGFRGQFAIHYLSQFAKKKLDDYPLLIHPKSATSNLIDNVNAWIGEISPNTRVVIEDIATLNKVKLGFEVVKSIGSTREYRPENVGFGLSIVLPVIISLLTAETNRLIIIENPEAHIHPRGQSELGKLLFLAALSGAQVFVETHSDHILNGVRVAARTLNRGADQVRSYFFERAFENESYQVFANIKKIRIDNEGNISDWPLGFFDEWDKNLLSLI